MPSGLTAALLGAQGSGQGASVIVVTIALVVVLITEIVPEFELPTYRRGWDGWMATP